MILGDITLAAFLFWSAVMVGASYLGGLLLAPKAPEAEGDIEGAASRKWNPHTTQQEDIARPRSWGKNQHLGNIIAKWTDVDGSDREILHLLIDHGDGPTEGIIAPIEDNTFLNDQPATNFGDSVDIQERVGTMNQTVMTGFEKLKLEYKQNTELLYNEEHIWTTPNSFFDDIEYTLLFPYGIMRNHSDGSHHGTTAGFLVRIREHPAGGWTTLFNTTITGDTREPIFKKYVANTQVPGVVVYGKQYDLSITRTSGNSTTKHTNDSFFRSAREVIDTAFTHPGRALVGIRAIATSKLSGSLDVKVIREDRIIWNGTTGDLEYSNNRAWVTWDAVTLPVIDGDGGANPWTISHYNGIDPQYLDLVFFQAWATFCAEAIDDGYGATEPRCPCNLKVSEFTDVFSLAHKIAKVGRAYIYWDGNLLTGWIDDEVTTPTDLVTMDSIMSKTWENAWAVTLELAGKVEVLYEDEKQGYERTQAGWNSDTIANHKNIVSVEGVGLKTRGTAVHYANYLLTRNDLIRNKNKFRVHKDGFRYKLGDTIRLQSRIANWGAAFRVVSSTADTITVDRNASAEIVPTDALHIRTYDTTLKVVVTDTYVVDSVVDNVITATVNWTVTPVKGNLVAVGPAGAIKLRRIVKLTPTQDNYFNVEVETYDANLFNADNLDPDNPLADYIWPGTTLPLDEPLTQATVQDMLSRSIPASPNLDTPWPANITWNDNTPGAGFVSWSKTDADELITFRLKGTTHLITAGNTDKEFIYWKPAAPTVFTGTDVFPYAELSAGSWLVCRNINGTASPSTPLQTLHAGLIQVGTITAAYGQIADATITAAKIAALAVEEAKIKNLNVTTLKLANNAVTIPTSAYTAAFAEFDATAGGVTIQQLTFTSTGLPVHFSCSFTAYHADPTWVEIFLYRGGTEVYFSDNLAMGGDAYSRPMAFSIEDTPGAGAVTYYLKARSAAGNRRAYNRSMLALEVKK